MCWVLPLALGTKRGVGRVPTLRDLGSPQTHCHNSSQRPGHRMHLTLKRQSPTVGQYYHPAFQTGGLAQQAGLASEVPFLAHEVCPPRTHGMQAASLQKHFCAPSGPLHDALAHTISSHSSPTPCSCVLAHKIFSSVSPSSCCSDTFPVGPGASLHQTGKTGRGLGFVPSPRPGVGKMSLCT